MNQSRLNFHDKVICVAGVVFLLFSIWYVQAHPVGSAQAQAPLERKMRVLIVPGHEPNAGGTSFKGLLERDMAVKLGNDLKAQLEKDGHFEVFITRDEKKWNPVFSAYFNKYWSVILKWEIAARANFNRLIAQGKVKKPVVTVGHNVAPANMAIRLYGISRWANENKIDVTINIHFNDDGNHRRNRPGNFRGFSIYVPVAQYDNSVKSHALAKKVFTQLKTVEPVSNFDGEKAGIVDDPKLIAVGANNTLKAASLVIEYGYIYESKFTDSKLRASTLEDLAKRTFQGLNEYRLTR